MDCKLSCRPCQDHKSELTPTGRWTPCSSHPHKDGVFKGQVTVTVAQVWYRHFYVLYARYVDEPLGTGHQGAGPVVRRRHFGLSGHRYKCGCWNIGSWKPILWASLISPVFRPSITHRYGRRHLSRCCPGGNRSTCNSFRVDRRQTGSERLSPVARKEQPVRIVE